jgi:hypothetical protein
MCDFWHILPKRGSHTDRKEIRVTLSYKYRSKKTNANTGAHLEEFMLEDALEYWF